jgi:hypothetical protein
LTIVVAVNKRKTLQKAAGKHLALFQRFKTNRSIVPLQIRGTTTISRFHSAADARSVGHAVSSSKVLNLNSSAANPSAPWLIASVFHA